MQIICLTYDTDHMDEIRMDEFLNSVEIPGAGTFFCTQKYMCLENTHHETGPHPFLSTNNWDDELISKKGAFPKAESWRSHSCVFSHILAEWCRSNGYKYISTHDHFSEANLKPIKSPWGIWQLPIYYMDNMDFSRNKFWADDEHKPFSSSIIKTVEKYDGLYVFDFHPIHLLLNTPNAEYYFKVRDAFKEGAPIDSIRYKGKGTKTFYDELINKLKNIETSSVRMDQVLGLYQ